MTLTQFLSILRARWGLALVVLLATVLATTVVSLLWPKQYKATASVVIDFKPDPVSALFGAGATPTLMNTQVDIIKSDRVAERVVKLLKLAESPQFRQQWQEQAQGKVTIESWLAERFQRGVDVEPSRESSVISVSYKSEDPRIAAALANAFVQAYLDTSLELRVDPAKRYAGFFESRSREAREALEQAQARLSQFQKEKAIIATDERIDVENARLNELSSQYTTLQAISAESGSRQLQAQGKESDRLQEVLNNPLLSALKGDITRSEAALQQMSIRLGDNHPQVLEAKASLAELRSRFNAETTRVTGGVTMSNTINRQRQAEVRASLEAQREKVLRMKAVRDEGLVLVREVDNAQRSYDAILQRVTQTSLESQTTQSNINLLTQATPPLDPATPRVFLNVILSVVIGALLAVALVLLLELRQRRVRSIGDVVAALDLPVIAVLPARAGRLGAASLQSLQQRMVAALPRPAAASSKGS